MKEVYEYERVLLPLGAPIFFQRVQYEKQREMVQNVKHFHEMYEVILFHRADGVFWVDGYAVKMKGPMLVYVPPLAIHEFDWGEEATSWYIGQFKGDFLEQLGYNKSLPEEPVIRYLSLKEYHHLANLCQWFYDMNQSIGEEEKLMPFQGSVFQVLLDWIVYQSEKETFTGEQDNRINSHGVQKFFPLIQYLEREKHYQISVDEASKLCGLSRSHFLAMFKEVFYQSFGAFLLTRRISAAKSLLADPKYNVSEIASMLDFRDSGYFSKVFRDETGESPSEYRKRFKARF